MFKSIEEISPRELKISIYFEDGNADLGLNNFGSDLLAPYNPVFSIVAAKNEPCRYLDTIDFSPLNPADAVDYSIVKTLFNPNGNNYHIRIFKKVEEDYVLTPYGLLTDACLQSDTIMMPDARFPRLSEDIQDEPIDGTLDLTINLAASSLSAKDTFQLEISIFDRSLNQSNVIRTAPYAFKPQ